MSINDRRQILANVFIDTQKFYTEDPRLADAVAYSKSHTVLYAEDDYPSLPEKREETAEITVTKHQIIISF